MKRKFIAGLLVLPLLSGAWIDAGAAAINARGPEFFIATRGVKVAVLLKDIGANFGVPVIVSKEINDVYAGTLSGTSAQAVLDDLARASGIAWYYDGNVAYAYKSSEARSEVIAPAHLPASELRDYLQNTGGFNSTYCKLRSVNQFNALEVFGVPECLARVAKLSKQLDEKLAATQKTDEAVQVFPLRYASAIDSSYTYRNEQVTIPGVVSELRDMSVNRALPIASNVSVIPAASPGGMGMPNVPVIQTAAAGAPSASNSGLPLFSADTRNNAVIVRDLRSNLPLYADLIAQLDKRPVQIEISVAIIDVDASNLSNLGVDFGGSVRLGPGKLEFNKGSSTPDGTFSSVIGSTGDFFVRVNALEQTSKAKILSRPSVVTLNNVQAVLDHNVTFYTKLQAEKAVKLEAVAAGSLMRVTPRLVEENGIQEVMLTLDVQDGQQAAPLNKVENLPQIKNSSITTQAVLKPGQSLLLGGFVQDKAVEGQSKLPWLGDLPLVGQLFRNNSKETRSVVRLFLIKAEPADGRS